MKDLVKAYKDLNWVIKLILCIPFLEIVTSVVRVLDGICENNVLKIVLSVLTIFPGAAFMWVVDLIWVLVYKRHFWL
jgi:ABC-type Na+ efflux pump permease subunit